MLAQLRAYRPSPAMVVALIALFVALGGSSYAAIQLGKNSVTSRTIANGEVRRADIAEDAINSARVADFSLRGRDFKPGQIPVGPQGPKGDPGATSVTVRAAHGNDKVTVYCQPGERATGGGAHSVNGVVVGQGPTAEPLAFYAPPDELPYVGYTPNAWSAAAESGGGTTDVTAWVVCAAP
jgi:hypothetical protein